MTLLRQCLEELRESKSLEAGPSNNIAWAAPTSIGSCTLPFDGRQYAARGGEPWCAGLRQRFKVQQ